MTSPFRKEIIDAARALWLRGYHPIRIAAHLRERYPEEAPAWRTIYDWQKLYWHDLTPQESADLEQNEYTIAAWADDLVMRKMSDADKDPAKLDRLRLPELVMAAGVYRDKSLNRARLAIDQAQRPQVFVLAPGPLNRAQQLLNPPADVVEAETVVVEGAQPSVAAEEAG